MDAPKIAADSDEHVARNDDAAGRNAAPRAQRKRPLTSTERSRNSRARKRAEETMVRRRPDLTPGVVDPLANAIVSELLDSGDCPGHLLGDDGAIRPRWRYAIDAWAASEAVARLTRAWVAGLPGVEAAVTAVSESDERGAHKGGRSVKRTVTRLVEGPLAALERAERRAGTTRAALGLDPASAARLGQVAAPTNLMMTPAYLAAVSRSDEEIPDGGS